MNPNTPGKTIFKAAMVLIAAVAISSVPCRLQAGDKKDEKKTTGSSGGSKSAASTTHSGSSGTTHSGSSGTTHTSGSTSSTGGGGATSHGSTSGGSGSSTISGRTTSSGGSGTKTGSSTSTYGGRTTTSGGSGTTAGSGTSTYGGRGNTSGGGGNTGGSGTSTYGGRGNTSGGGGNTTYGGRGNTSGGGGYTGRGGRVSGTASSRNVGPVYTPGRNVRTTSQPGGFQSHYNAGTRTTIQTGPGGHVTVIERSGLRASGFVAGGRAGHIEHMGGDGSRMVVNRGFRGAREVVVVRPGGVRVVAYGGGGRAFVERPFRPGFVARTFIIGGRPWVHVYGAYTYRGFHYYGYVPSFYYHPSFYGWAMRPWGPRVAFGWGWGPAAPWYYGGYFAPEPYYPTPSLWLTDYLLAENLRGAYENRQLAADEESAEPEIAQEGSVALTPEVKMEIAAEVRQQIEDEQAAQSQPAPAPVIQGAAEAVEAPPPALKQRVFVVSSNLDVAAAGGGQSCALSPGDIIERTPGQPITSDGKVAVNVMSSKPGDCPTDFATQIDIAALQEMQNEFREKVDAGLASLANNQGKGGLPSGPAANPTPSALGQAPPDPQAQSLVAGANQQADQTEAEVQQAASGGQ